jgi:hypothetical protein
MSGHTTPHVTQLFQPPKGVGLHPLNLRMYLGAQLVAGRAHTASLLPPHARTTCPSSKHRITMALPCCKWWRSSHSSITVTTAAENGTDSSATAEQRKEERQRKPQISEEQIAANIENSRRRRASRPVYRCPACNIRLFTGPNVHRHVSTCCPDLISNPAEWEEVSMCCFLLPGLGGCAGQLPILVAVETSCSWLLHAVSVHPC